MVETSWNTAGRALGIGPGERPSGAGSRPVMAELAMAMTKGHEPIRPMTLGTMVTLASNQKRRSKKTLAPADPATLGGMRDLGVQSLTSLAVPAVMRAQ
jgi:hypothetical protein